MSAADNRKRYLAAFNNAPKVDGKVGKEEMAKLLQSMGKELESIGPLFNRINADGNEGLDQNEFLLFMEELDNAWVRIQQKTFTRWGNNVLSNRLLKLNDISVDLRDGTLLGPLIEVLSKKSVGKINKNPKMKLNRIENLNTCLNFLKNDGIKLVNISSEDLEQGNIRITLGLIWMLILKYQIGDAVDEGSPKWALLEWVKKQCAPYKVGQNLKNFKSGWSDGKVLSALTDSLGEPMNSTINLADISEDPYEATKHAMYTAEEKFEIPRVMDAPDLVENPDEHSIMTYISYFRDYADTQKNRSNPAQTTAHGPGVEGGDARAEVAPFTVVAKNSQGKKCTQGGDMVGVNVKGPKGEEVRADIKDNGDGTYSGSYPLSAGPGTYQVDIVLRGAPIKDSPFRPFMEAGNAGKSWAEGDGLSKGKTNRPAKFTIHAVDKDGKPLKNGGDPFKVAITGPHGPINANMSDNGDGTYPVSYNPQEEGDYKIDVTLHGNPIKDNPFTSHIKRAPNASRSWVDGPGLKRAYDNRPAFFTVHAFDDVGQPVSGDDCTVAVVPVGSGGAPVPVFVNDNGDGTYSVEYRPDVAGKYNIVVKLDGDDVKGTPVPITVREGADASKTGHANFKVTIVSRNKNGDIKSEGGDDFSVRVVGLGDAQEEIPSKAKDNGDGTYTAEYQLAAPKEDSGPREYMVEMKLNDEFVAGFPTRQYM